MINTEKHAMRGNRISSHPAGPFGCAIFSGWRHPLNQTLMILGILLAAAFGLPSASDALQPLSEIESRNMTATSGLSMALDDTVLYFGSESVKFTSRENRDVFSAYTPAQGYLSLNNTQGLITINDNWCTLDIGTYQRPNETYRVADIAKSGDDYGWLQSGRLWGASGTISSTPQYWTIPNPPNAATRPEPMDGQYSVIQADLNDLVDAFDLTTTLKFYGGAGSERTLSALGVSGIHMPSLTVSGVAMPGARLTLYPDSRANINFELRTRLTIDEITLANPSTGAQELRISGIHLGEAFFPAWTANPLVSHKGTTGTAATVPNTSAWGSSFASWMYSGYFLIGNLNQVNFDDLKMETDNPGGDQITFASGRQLYNRTINTNGRNPLYYCRETDDIDVPVWIEANPMSFNIGIRDSDHNIWDGYSYFSLTGGLHGSLRVDSLAGWNDAAFGPAAVDGLRVKYLEVEFPGGYQRECFRPPAQGGASLGWYEKGRVYPGQLAWLEANDAAVPSASTGALQWLLTP